MMFLGLSKPSQPFIVQTSTRLFSKNRQSSSESDSDFESEFVVPKTSEKKHREQKRSFTPYKQVEPSELLGGIKQYIAEKGDHATPEEWNKYLSQINRAMAISYIETQNNQEQIKKLDSYLAAKILDNPNDLTNVPIISEFAGIVLGRFGHLQKYLESPKAITEVMK
jgi:hypothetical protein